MSPLVLLIAGSCALVPLAERAERLPLGRDEHGRVSVLLRLDGSGPYRFLVDTGASLSSIAARLADRLGLAPAGQVRATSVGQFGPLRLVRPPAVALGSRRVVVPWIVVLPDEPDHPLAAFDGILGQDVLRQLDGYLIDWPSATFWIDPPPQLTARLKLGFLGSMSRSGPLSVVGESGSRWTIDTGASHVVLFGGEGASGGPVPLVSAMGTRVARWTGPARLVLGTLTVVWAKAVTTTVAERGERGLLPLSLFDALHVDNLRGTARAAARGSAQRSNPDIAAYFGALEHDAGIAGGPRGVPDVAGRAGKRRQLLNGARGR